MFLHLVVVHGRDVGFAISDEFVCDISEIEAKAEDYGECQKGDGAPSGAEPLEVDESNQIFFKEDSSLTEINFLENKYPVYREDNETDFELFDQLLSDFMPEVDGFVRPPNENILKK